MNTDKESGAECEQLLFPDGITFESSRKVRTTQITPLYRLAETKKDLRVDRKSLMVELRGIAPRSVWLLATVLQA